MMKMCDLTLESYYWTNDKVECPYELLVLLKEQANMDYFHKQLNNYCLYSLSQRDNFMISEIDLVELRKFQINVISPEKPFKPIPTGFKISDSRKRSLYKLLR